MTFPDGPRADGLRADGLRADGLRWVPLSGDGAPVEVVGLAVRCRAADGGMPHAVSPGFLGRRWAAAPIAATRVRFGLRAADGQLLAAGAVGPVVGGVVVTGLVDPVVRGRGIGAALLDRLLELAADRAVTVETEFLTSAAAELFAARGFRVVFAEDVMRIGLPAPSISGRRPAGIVLSDWSSATASRFHAVYDRAFRERPGFPGPSADEWIADNEEDDEFRPGWSVLAHIPGLGDAGFVTAAVGWIVQVGVVPAARGQGLGGALVRESLARMAADGAPEAWLNVNVDNPGAADLYRRLGFVDSGRRARYQR